MENSIELLPQKSVKQMRATITIVSVVTILTLILGGWSLLSGGIGFYPNVTLFQDKPCGGYYFYTRPMIELRFAHCFVSSDTKEQIDEWYRTRGWFSFGERVLYPSVNLGITNIAVHRYFLTETQPDGTIMIVQSVQYFIGHPYYR